MILLFFSCSHPESELPPTKGKISSTNYLFHPLPRHDTWIYCTEEDAKQDKKTPINHDDTLCLRDFLQIDNYRIFFRSTVLGPDPTAPVNIGYNELIVEDSEKNILVQKKIEDDPYLFFTITGFPKLRKGRYLEDLDGDGLMEFAIVHYGSDRNRFAKATIYSLLQTGKIRRYGVGTYNKDAGAFVLFGCPDCHTMNFEACRKCY